MESSSPDDGAQRAARAEAGDSGGVAHGPERLSDRVAEAMLDTILRRGLRPGDQLPSERELGEQFGVSRTVVREAVRVLIARGVVQARPGTGLRVAAVGPDAVSSSISLYLHGRDRMAYDDVHEVRELLEVHIAGLAAERGTDAEIARLRAQAEQIPGLRGDVDALIANDVEFHRALARMTHNDLYLILLDSLGAVMYAVRRATHGRASAAGEVDELHRVIAERVAAHDPAGARAAMSAHLEHRLLDWTTLGQDVDLSAGRAAGG